MPIKKRSAPKRRKIFISYRRSDSGNATARLDERLQARYGRQHVFKDLDSIVPGEHFARAIRDAIVRSAVVLVIIGHAWADVRGEDGKRRLDDPDDFVRREVEEAFSQGVNVVPVLVE